MQRRIIGAIIAVVTATLLTGCVANGSTAAGPAALESEASDFGRANAEATNFVFLTEETQMVALACSIVDAGTLTQLDAGSISSFGGHLSNFVDGAVPLSMSGGSGIASVDDAKAIAPIFQKMGCQPPLPEGRGLIASA